MPDVFIGEAMVEALAELGAETTVVEEAAPATPPVQVPLFEPPPFDFEEAYDELHRLDQRAKNRKAAWESLKAAARDAKEDYDSAINDLHDKFDEIDSARRVAAARQQKPHASNATTEGGDTQMSELDETLGDELQEPQDETPEEPSDVAPSE